MSVIVFAVGRPGSGKSTAVRRMMELAKGEGYSTIHIRDYTILQDMSIQDEHRTKFHVFNEPEGFDVLDFSAFNIALERLIVQIDFLERSHEYDVVFVEFARRTYEASFEKLSKHLLSPYYILFVEAQLEICMRRIDERITKLQGPDHHFISKKIMMSYYNIDNLPCMNDDFTEHLGLPRDYLKAICNDGLLEKFREEVEDYEHIISQEIIRRRKLSSVKTNYKINSLVEESRAGMMPSKPPLNMHTQETQPVLAAD